MDGNFTHPQHFTERIQVLGYCPAGIELAKIVFNINIATAPQTLTLA